MPYSETEIEALKDYKIMNPDGTWRTADLIRGDAPLGPGPLISLDAVNRLLGADTTPDKRWVHWILFQAGGGQAAKNENEKAMRRMYTRFIAERTNGWTDRPTGRHFDGIPPNQAEARWVIAEPKFREALEVCDQDAVDFLHTFGYFRDWPGNANIYRNVVEAVTRYLKFYPKLQQMNKELREEGGEQLPETPEDIPTWGAMAAIAQKVERYFASKKSRTDLREETVYEDDVLTALVPLTYAAAVEFGHDLWPWANRTNFEQVLSGEAYRDAWKARTQQGHVFVYITFKAPVPAWVTRRGAEWEFNDLTDLALVLDKDNANGNPDEWTVYDQENRNTLTIGQVKQMILAEPNRVVDPADVESVSQRGANVYKDEAEAENVVASLERALQTVKKWVSDFDVNTIKSDVLTLD